VAFDLRPYYRRDMPSASRPASAPEGDDHASLEHTAPPADPPCEILDVSAADSAALDRLGHLERTGALGLFCVAGLALRGAYWAGEGHFRGPAVLPFVLAIVGVVLGAYAVWSQANPDGVGQTILRLDPEREIAAGHELAVTVLLRPRKRLDLDPLQVRVVARAADVGLTKGDIVHESRRTIGPRCVIEAGRAVRFEGRIPIPEDVPTSRPGKPVTWRVEVAAGEPAVSTMTRLIRVVPGATARRDAAG